LMMIEDRMDVGFASMRRMLCVVLAVCCMSLLATSKAAAQSVPVGSVSVRDGYTVHIEVRLVGLDTPERGRAARCEGERELG
jgi:hypothetical protein